MGSLLSENPFRSGIMSVVVYTTDDLSYMQIFPFQPTSHEALRLFGIFIIQVLNEFIMTVVDIN